MRILFTFSLLALGLFACAPSDAESTTNTDEVAADTTAAQFNTLTEAERAAGWVLLFDGQTTAGWRSYGADTIGTAWRVEDGTLQLEVLAENDWQVVGGGDIITQERYDNYELNLEWKIDSCGNSGIIYNAVEVPDNEFPWQSGPEMQILDNTCHPDAKIVTHRAGDLYDFITAEPETVLPAGEWNQVRLINRNGQIEHWLNGQRVVAYDMNSEAWPAMIAKSKFKDMAEFGRHTGGHIVLQDHGDRVAFRNIKLRRL